MPLAPGAWLGPYEVLCPLGSGGMGEVYKARDRRLNRQVAIKLLRAEAVGNPSRRRRFVQEARLASALDHPNIVAIFDILELGEQDAIVMQLVEGRTLRDALRRGPLPLRETLETARQIASAVEHAHARGIVHRDLKPENVMITPDGARVLDFGIARGTPPVIGAAPPTAEVHVPTETGVVLGTPRYMPPEQHAGEYVDGQADIWAFGCVLFEMLTGRPAFGSKGVQSTDTEPDWTLVPAGTPPRVRDVVRRCLRVDRMHRLHAIADARIEIEESLAIWSGAPPTYRGRAIALSILVAGIVLLGGREWIRGARTAAPPLAAVPITATPAWEDNPALSPDGTHLAFVADDGHGEFLYVSVVGAGAPVQITHIPGASWPAWSPDERRIAFLRDDGVFVVPALGGLERRVARRLSPRDGLAWADSESLIVVDREDVLDVDSLYLLALASGTRTRLTHPAAGRGDRLPTVSPDGTMIAFVRAGENQLLGDVYAAPRAGGEAWPVTSVQWEITDLDWAADGRALVFAGGTADQTRLWKLTLPRATPEPLSIGEHAMHLSVARHGHALAFSEEFQDFDIWRAPGPAAAVASSHMKLIASTRTDYMPQFSPDGRHISFLSSRDGSLALWMCAVDGTACERLADVGPVVTGDTQWSPGGDRIVFARPERPGQPALFVTRIEDRVTERITSGSFPAASPSWSPDGRWLYFNRVHEGEAPTRREVWKVPSEGGEPVQIRGLLGRFPKVGPDGHWVYFTKGAPRGPIWKRHLESGEEAVALDRVVGPQQWCFWRNSLVYILQDPVDGAAIASLDLGSGETQRLVTLGRGVMLGAGVSVSPDGGSILYVRDNAFGGDIMLVESFR